MLGRFSGFLRRALVGAAVAVAVVAVPLNDAGARSSSRSSGGYSKPSSGGSSSFWDRSGGGYSKPGSSSSSSGGYTKPGTDAPSSSGGYTKPGTSSSDSSSSSGYTKPSTSAPAKAPKGSAFDQAISKRQSAASLDSLRKEQGKFAQPSSQAPGGAGATPFAGRVQQAPDYNSYYGQRDSYYASQRWAAPPYAYQSRPSFGMWDALALWSILDMVGSHRSAMAYNHSSDPGYQEWRREADRLARDNSELRDKLNKLDGEVATMKDKPRDPAYLPPGIPAQVALAPNVVVAPMVDANADTLRLATGSSSGNYKWLGDRIKGYSKQVPVQVLETGGSEANVKLLTEAKADAAFVQSDVLDLFLREHPDVKLSSLQATLYPEYVQIIANTKSGIKSIKDLDPDKHVLFVGPQGSGTARTWQGLARLEPRFAKLQVMHASNEEALKTVKSTPGAAMMFVAGLNSDFLKTADKEAGDQLRLIPIDSWNLGDNKDRDGNRVYSFHNIPSGTYPHLQAGWLWGSKKVSSLTVEAVLVVSAAWADKAGEDGVDGVAAAVKLALPEVKEKVGVK